MPQIFLETKRLRFSIITQNDFENVHKTLNNRNTCDAISFLSWPLTDDQVQNWCDKAIQGEQNSVEYLFIAHHNDAPVGCIGLHLEEEKLAETGYWVATDSQGQGIATEMLQGVLEFSFYTLGLENIYATTAYGNEASDMVLLKNGFVETGTKDVEMPDGSMRPSKLFTKTK